MNDCVVSDAFVIPSSSGSDVAGFLLLLRPLVLVAERLLVDVLALEELGLARIDHAHLLQHLAHDHADVLVVDLHALQAIDLLHFVQQVLLHRARPLDPQNVVRIDRTFGQPVAGAHAVAFVHAQVLAGTRPRTAAPPRVSSSDRSRRPRLRVGCTKISRLPRLMSPNRTTPSISEIVAGSFGLRASNSSATRGRPPVMSRVLYASRLTLAIVVAWRDRAAVFDR